MISRIGGDVCCLRLFVVILLRKFSADFGSFLSDLIAMSNIWFKFKRFTVMQDRCAMKVGTDGVLLGAWAPLDGGLPLLDIGAGTGIVSLVAAQRLSVAMMEPHAATSGGGNAPKWVTAVELDPDAAAQAAVNFESSPWGDCMECVCCDVNDFNQLCWGGEELPVRSYGTILCNPPYFRDSLRCPDGSRNAARHGDSLNFDDLGRCVARLLSPDGLFSAIIPFDAVRDFVRAMAACSLYHVRETDVCTKVGKEPKRSLVSFSFKLSPCCKDTISILDSEGQETPEYVSLVKDFYLKY